MLKIRSSGRWEREGGTVLYDPNYTEELSLKGRTSESEIFSLAIDESTDVSDMNLLC
jgi:hypothetical protein